MRMPVSITFIMITTIRNHPFTYKIFGYILLYHLIGSCQRNLFWNCNFDFSCKLSILCLLNFLHCIPQCSPVIIFSRYMIRKKYLFIYNSSLSSIIMNHSVIFICNAATTTICGSCHSRPSLSS